MKNLITFLTCTLCIFSATAQSDLVGNQIVIPERTPVLEALYLQANMLEVNGTADEINANRLAIKNAWQTVDSNVAELYRPIVSKTSTKIGGDAIYTPSIIMERPDAPAIPEWGVDKLLKDDWIDGVDMDVTKNGHIYIGAYENLLDFGGVADSIYIYRSTDGGISFDKWKSQASSSPIKKLQIISMDGSGDNYLLAYVSFESEYLQALQWNMSTGTFNFSTVDTDVLDFSVDSNYPTNTSSQRVFATYQKSNNEIHSARSTAGSYGFDWVDASFLGLVGEQVSFAYGRDGGSYTAFIGYVSKSLRAMANSNSNDPASWGNAESVSDGSLVEVINPSISAARKPFASDKVLIWASSRTAGSSNNYDGAGYLRTNGGAYSKFSSFGSGGSNWNVAHTDTWVRKQNDTETIRTSYVKDNISGADNNTNRSLTFNGTDFDTFEPVADASLSVYDGFASAIAETNDNLPCLAFSGTGSGNFGWGLYFDSKNSLGINENRFENFKFYPNPVQDVLNISAKSVIENVSIFSLLGQKVMEVSVNQNASSINIESLTNGVYIMKVMIDGTSASYKIVKQ